MKIDITYRQLQAMLADPAQREAVETFQTEVVAAGGTLILNIEEGWTHQNTCEQSYTDTRLDWLFAHSRAKKVLPGDVNDDGTIDAIDLNALINIILDKASTSDFPGNADTNGDGEIDAIDLNNKQHNQQHPQQINVVKGTAFDHIFTFISK